MYGKWVAISFDFILIHMITDVIKIFGYPNSCHLCYFKAAFDVSCPLCTADHIINVGWNYIYEIQYTDNDVPGKTDDLPV